jgi:hypothetical protein
VGRLGESGVDKTIEEQVIARVHRAAHGLRGERDGPIKPRALGRHCGRAKNHSIRFTDAANGPRPYGGLDCEPVRVAGRPAQDCHVRDGRPSDLALHLRHPPRLHGQAFEERLVVVCAGVLLARAEEREASRGIGH